MKYLPTKIAFLAATLALTGLWACGDDGTTGPDDTAADTVADTGTDDTTVTTDATDTGDDTDTVEPGMVLHYHRPDGVYEGVMAAVEVDGTSVTIGASAVDGFGASFPIDIADTATAVTYQFTATADDGTVDPAAPTTVTFDAGPQDLWHFSGLDTPRTEAPPGIPDGNQLVVYYLRGDNAYQGWGAHVWMDVVRETQWIAPLTATGVDADLGAWYIVDLAEDAREIGLIIHKGDEKDPGPDMILDVVELGGFAFLTTGSTEVSPFPVEIPEFSISGARAHWLEAETLSYKPSPAAEAATAYELRYAADASVEVVGLEIVGGETLTLTKDAAGLNADLKATWPHLRTRTALTVGAADLTKLPAILKGEVVLVARDANGAALDATRVQLPGVLDDLFFYDDDLGLFFEGKAPGFAVWAPTAQDVRLVRYDGALTEVSRVDMTEQDGVWFYTGADSSWYGDYYRYEVTVFAPISGDVETLEVTDPYSVSLSTDSLYSQIIDLTDNAVTPAGWSAVTKPRLDAPEDIVLYESHVRDFSAFDLTVPAADRGKFGAFLHNGQGGADLSDGMSHLAGHAAAGLTHLHWLPTFDLATVTEDPADRVDVNDTFARLCERNGAVPTAKCTEYGTQTIAEVLASLDPASSDAQEIVTWMAGLDGFNWGYDPFHYSVPEGSYASDAKGETRIIEMREAIKALWEVDLRIVMDVVYNHTNSSGLGAKSVLDRVVPGYYHRLNSDTGQVETSTCCANTATEHKMMEKLMIDSVVLWATQYKIDAFRFDLMGHHMKANMVKLRETLDGLSLAKDGVDGPGIYLYGEGWNFGEVANNKRGTNATQRNMAGTGIGTFNDRLRDAVRGGGAFDSGAEVRMTQGFINGSYTDPNELNVQGPDQREDVLLAMDQIRIGMAGGLSQFKLVDRNDAVKTGFFVPYNGEPTGYTDDPQETINYVSKHDNQTLWDINAYKTKTGLPAADRARQSNLGVALTILSQGIPFLHLGVDMLRSKSMERDSYNSGDWFNRVDFTYATNNWNVGLPNAEKDQANWPLISSILADTSIAPSKADIEASVAHTRDLLAVRKSSVLLRLRTADQIKSRVRFYNSGPNQIAGFILMSVSDGTCAGADLDPNYDGMLVVINAQPVAQEYKLNGWTGWELHPVLQASSDATVASANFVEATGAFNVPARTAAVFVRPQSGGQGDGPPCNDL